MHAYIKCEDLLNILMFHMQGCHILEQILEILEFNADPWNPWKVLEFYLEFWNILEKSLNFDNHPWSPWILPSVWYIVHQLLESAPLRGISSTFWHPWKSWNDPWNILELSLNFVDRISWQPWYGDEWLLSWSNFQRIYFVTTQMYSASHVVTFKQNSKKGKNPPRSSWLAQ